MTPMKQYSTNIRNLCEHAVMNGFKEVRLNAARGKSTPWPYDDKVGVENDHLIILRKPKNKPSENGESVAMVFNYVDVEPSVKFTYKPAGENGNDYMEESVAYSLDQFKELLNSFVKELPSIRGFGSVTVQDAFIAAWMKHFQVGSQNPTDIEKEIEHKLGTLYAEYEIGVVEKQEERKKAEESIRRASSTVDKKLKESELTKRRDELNKELDKVNRGLSLYKEKLRDIHGIEEKKQRFRSADREFDAHGREYRKKREALLNQYPKTIARKFNRRFQLNGK